MPDKLFKDRGFILSPIPSRAQREKHPMSKIWLYRTVIVKATILINTLSCIATITYRDDSPMSIEMDSTIYLATSSSVNLFDSR